MEDYKSMIYLTERELEMVHNALLAKRMFKGQPPVLGVNTWEPWMEPFLHKIEDAIESSKLGAQLRQD